MRFKLVDSNVFELPGTQGRFVHLGTAHYGLREYICMHDTITNKVYIEEMTGGTLSFIMEDDIAMNLAKLFEVNGVIDMMSPAYLKYKAEKEKEKK